MFPAPVMKWHSTISGISLRFEQLRVLERDVDVGADVESHHLGIDDEPAAQNHARLVELADALVDGGTRNPALARNLQEGHAGVLYQELENLAIDRIQGGLGHGDGFI